MYPDAFNEARQANISGGSLGSVQCLKESPSNQNRILQEADMAQKRANDLREYYVLNQKFPEITRLVELYLQFGRNI